MAKSIYELLDSLETETSVPEVKDDKGKVIREKQGMVSHTLPREKLPTSEQFEDEAKLLAFAKESGQLHQCLQSGFQARVIDYRAIFKSMKKDETWSQESGQKKVDTNEWKIVERPNSKASKLVSEAKIKAGLDMANAMKLAGLEDGIILASLIPVYGEDVANEIIGKLAE